MKKATVAFVIVLIFGIIIGCTGLFFIIISLGKPFSINNLQPAFALVAGFFLFIAGAVISSLCIRIRWMQRVEGKLDKVLEEKSL